MNHPTPAPTPDIRVMIVDESRLLRLGIRTSLETETDFTVVGDFETAAEAMAKIEELQPKVVLVSVTLPDTNGFEACYKMSELAPDARVIMMSSRVAGSDVLTAMLAGGAGFLLKDSPEFELIRMVRYNGQGAMYQIPEVAELSRTNLRAKGCFIDLARLSEKERRVVMLVADGLKNTEVGDSLGLSHHTVRSHLRRIFDKLGVSSRAELAAFVPLLAMMDFGRQPDQPPPGHPAP